MKPKRKRGFKSGETAHENSLDPELARLLIPSLRDLWLSAVRRVSR